MLRSIYSIGQLQHSLVRCSAVSLSKERPESRSRQQRCIMGLCRIGLYIQSEKMASGLSNSWPDQSWCFDNASYQGREFRLFHTATLKTPWQPNINSSSLLKDRTRRKITPESTQRSTSKSRKKAYLLANRPSKSMRTVNTRW